MLYLLRRPLTRIFNSSSLSSRNFHIAAVFRMKEKRIVSSFICTPPDSKDGLKFALFKRSTKVSTYKQKWAVCSGSVETTDPTPEFAARREIQEETQLTSSDITLYNTGKSFKLVDKELDITWIIHTFSFLLNDPNKKLVIEGEHTEYKFIRPDELSKMDHVPALEVGMTRVLPGKVVSEGIKKLRDDHDSGAEELAIIALDTLKQVIDSEDLKSCDNATEWWKEFRLAAWMLAKNGRPDMGPAIEGALFKTLVAVADEIQRTFGASCYTPDGLKNVQLQRIKFAAPDGIKKVVDARKARMTPLTNSFLELVLKSDPWKAANRDPKKYISILTLSYSSSVVAVLNRLIRKAAPDTTIHLKVLESRPRYEGIAMVKNLFRSDLGLGFTALKHLKIDILSDAAVALAAKNLDFLILGSDKVSSAGDVSNKVGSLPACILAKTLSPKCKVAVIATTDKISSSSSTDKELNEEPKDYDAKIITTAYPKDVMEFLSGSLLGAQVRFRNPFFEWVPSKWVDVYVTEEGGMEKAKLKAFADDRGKLEEKLFGDI